MQIAYQLDPVTLAKIKKSFLIAGAGFIVAAFSIFMQDKAILAWLAAHPIAAAAVGSFAPVIVNALNEFRKGQAS